MQAELLGKVMNAAMSGNSTAASAPPAETATQSNCNPTTEQWAAKIQNETDAFKKKLYELLTTSEFSGKFFDNLQSALVDSIKNLPESQYLVRMADQEIFRSLINQFKLDDNFKMIFSYKLLGGDNPKGDVFLIKKIEQIIKTYDTEKGFTLQLKGVRDNYLKNFKTNAENTDQKGGNNCTMSKPKPKPKSNTRKHKSEKTRKQKSVKKKKSLRRWKRHMRGGTETVHDIITKTVAPSNEGINAQIPEIPEITNLINKSNNEPNKPNSEENRNIKQSNETTDETSNNSNQPSNAEPGTNKAIDEKIVSDLLARLSEIDSTDSDLRTIMLNLIKTACDNTLADPKKSQDLTNILSDKMKKYIENVYANLTLSSTEIFGFLLFYSFLFDEDANQNTLFGNFIDEQINNLKNEDNLSMDTFKKIFKTI